MAKSIQEQLLDAYEGKVETEGMTLLELKRLADLPCSADSLSRKLRGKQSLRSNEIEALARALRIQVITGKDIKAA